MGLKDQLTEDMKTSLRAGDSVRTGVLRLLRSSIKNEEIKLGHELQDDEVLKVLTREAKQRRDSIEAYAAADRQDLVQAEQAEQTIISTYLPQAMSEAQLRQLVEAAVQETGAVDAKQMGAVIGLVVKRAGARADGGTVSRLVRERLAGGGV